MANVVLNFFKDDLLPKVIERPVLSTVAVVFLIVFLAQVISALTFDRVIAYTEIDYVSIHLPSELDGYTIAFLTDIHQTPTSVLEEIADRVNKREVDLLLLGGDFDMAQIDRALDVIKTISTRGGIFGVYGNHDDPRTLSAAMSARGMTLLENNGTQIVEGLFLAGLSDYRTGQPDLSAALEGALDDDFILVLTHNPDVTMQPGFEQVHLTVAGHTHGGEVTLLGLWAPALPLVSRHGQRFRAGFANSAADTDVFVSRGIGRHLFRMFSRPQVVFLTLHES
ncbi:MAG: metallophosphoesterase family protein [Oscillospiraceae bacterium]|nr:metallophosphoesterase family protein [Oscillospiraceae bacterium]